ncbi:MAG: Cytochrome subunit of sulfide dehydrogenase [Pseudomonadota bacterium]|jgi:sulfide dehydrogenase cytochrome subunit
MFTRNLFFLGFILSPTVLADVPTPATLLAYNCFNCHGDNGVSKGGVPSIKGLPANILELTLKNYRDGTQVSTVMGRIAKGLNDDEIKELSAFIATLK